MYRLKVVTKYCVEMFSMTVANLRGSAKTRTVSVTRLADGGVCHFAGRSRYVFPIYQRFACIQNVILFVNPDDRANSERLMCPKSFLSRQTFFTRFSNRWGVTVP